MILLRTTGRLLRTTVDRCGVSWSQFPVQDPDRQQICIKHVLDGIDRRIGYTAKKRDLERWKHRTREVLRSVPDRKLQGAPERSWTEIRRGLTRIKELRLSLGPIERLRKSLHRLLMSQAYEIAQGRWAAFQRHPDRAHDVHRIMVEVIGRKWQALTVHYHHPGMPRTNNDAESVMRQLEQRLKTIGSFGSIGNAQAYVNLLVAYLRMKPYTDCKRGRKLRNGFSRLELAGVNNPGKDWLKMSLKRRV